ncbi:MAG: M64 family metallo-endopeptidase [Ignavibacteria bacterium]|nr:M64 family metallo-endopeptidase [Ignavibacteria bacterium]
MKNLILASTVAILAFSVLYSQPQVSFDEYFINKTMRIDYFHVGDALVEDFTLDQIRQQGIWAGNPRSPLDPFNNGRYYAKVYDIASNKLIFSKGYDTYFGEYKTTQPAKNGTKRTYHESVLLPYPRKPILFVIEVRDRKNVYHPSFSRVIDPNDYHIITEEPARGDKVFEVLKTGDPHEKVDIVLIAEGYTMKEESKFAADLERYTKIFFNWEPYRSYKKNFNVYGIFAPSPESGVDEPRKGVYRNTVLNSSFNSFDSERYLLIEDNKTLRDVAAQVPYDAIMIMVNSARYGGGALLNNYATFTSDGPQNEHVFHHEIGHSFGGLADEYFTASVTYDEFYPQGVEPSEPNITALLDPENLKWKELVLPGLSIPTEWGQEEFNNLSGVRNALQNEKSLKIDEMKTEGASDKEIEDVKKTYAERDKEVNDRITKFLVEHPLRGKVGAFEGAGFVPKGFYRSTVNSVMHKFTNEENIFYAVNEHAIIRVINYYSE